MKLKNIKTFEGIFDKLHKTIEEIYWKLSNNMLKVAIKDEYDKLDYHSFNLDFDKLYVRKYEKEHKLVIIMEYDRYNIIIEYFLNDKTLVGNIFDYKSNEQLYQFNYSATTIADIIDVFKKIFGKIKNGELFDIN